MHVFGGDSRRVSEFQRIRTGTRHARHSVPDRKRFEIERLEERCLLDGDMTPPRITNLLPTTDAKGKLLLSVALDASEDLKEMRAETVGNYSLKLPGPDKLLGTGDDTSVTIRQADYDAAAHRVTLTLDRALKLAGFFRVTASGAAGGLTDLANNALDGDADGNPGGTFTLDVAAGTSIKYVDSDSDSVSLKLSGGDLIVLKQGPQDPAPRLEIINRVPARSTLTGSVKRGKRGGDGRETFLTISGDPITNSLPAASFTVIPDTTAPAAPSGMGLTPTSDSGVSNTDGITNVVAPTVRGDAEEASIVRLFRNGSQVGQTTATAGTWQLTVGPLAEGTHPFTATATDAAGNTSPLSAPLIVRVDTTAPTTDPGLAGTFNTQFDSIDISFDEAMADAAFDTTSYSLVVEGGPNNGQPIAITAIDRSSDRTARIMFGAMLPNQSYRFTPGTLVTDLAGNRVNGAGGFPFSVAQPTHLRRFDPIDAEEDVSPTRVTLIYFDGPVDPVTVNADSLYLIANGQHVPGTIRVSSTEEFATFLYDDPLPASTEVRIVVEGNKILGRDNLLVDADGDGDPGGTGMAEFQTLPLTRVTGTEIFGYVYDAYNKVPRETLPIAVPAGDPQFDPTSTGTKTIPFSRAEFFAGTGTSTNDPRLFPNRVTSFIDASQVYGSDELRARELRRLDGSGKLKTSAGDHLPLNNAETFPNGPLMIANEGPFASTSLPAAGDVRAAEVPTLSAMHTLFVREHNRYADLLKAANPLWTDEQIYQAARRWVGALMEQITYQEFLPAILGSNPLPAYAGYQPNVDPSISALFSTAAFRLGHTLQSGSIQRLDAGGQSLPGGPLVIRNAFFNPNPLRQDGLDPYLRGLAAGRAQEFDTRVIDDLRNFLFGPPGAGGLDLVSINIQRGRDLGLPGYNQAREDLGLPRVMSFGEISSDAATAAMLQAVYGDVNAVDVWVGGLAEDHVPGGVVGPLFAAIIRDQFLRSRDGDRFWYENGQFSDADLTAIRATKLSDVIARNSGVTGLPANVFTTGAVNPGPGAGGNSGAPAEFRTIDGYDNNESNEHLGEKDWPLRADYTVSFGDGISTPGGIGRPNPRAISNAVAAQTGNSENAAGLTDLAVVWGQFLDHDLDLTPAQTSAGTNIPAIGATIRVDAFPDANGTTDKFGFFQLEDTPAPEFFVHIDGSTATTAPAGTTYPTVGKPFHTVPGERIQLNMAGMPFNIYLPPMAAGDVVPLSTTTDTAIGFGPGGMAELAQMFPGMDPSVFERLQVTYPAGSAIDDTGNAVMQGVVIPVPPDRLPAPLPMGQDPALVISIQAPGATSFDVPASLDFPNLDGMAPGEQALFWRFNHAAGRWEPVGTGTVSGDGETIESDGGVVGAPGWWFVDQGGCGGSGNSPQGNRKVNLPAAPEITTKLLKTSDADTITLDFPALSGAANTPSGGRCGSASPPPIEPSRAVTIIVEGPFADYYKPMLGGGIKSDKFTLKAGQSMTLSSVKKNLTELKADLNSGKLFEENILYGSKITVDEVITDSSGDVTERVRIFFPYMLIDATDPQKEDGTLKFARVINDGAAKERRELPLMIRAGTAAPNLSLSDPTNYFLANSIQQVWFDPTVESNAAGDPIKSKIQVKNPLNGALAGEINLEGVAVKIQGYKIDTASFEMLASQIGADDGTAFPGITAGQRALLDNDPPPAPPLLSERDVILNAIKSQTDTLFSRAGASAGIFDASALADGADNIVLIRFIPCADPNNLGGAEGNALEPVDIDLAKIVAVYMHRAEYSQLERAYRIAEEINKQLSGPIRFCFINFFNNNATFDAVDELKFAFGHNNAHEIGHHLGLFHTFGWRAGGTQVAGYDMRPRTDVMSQGLFMTDSQNFDITTEALKFGLHIRWTGPNADKALEYYNAYQAAGGNFNSISTEDENSGPGLNLFPSPTLGLFSDQAGAVSTTVDLGSVVVDGPGGASLADVWTLMNLGPGNLTVTSVGLSVADAAIAVSPNLSGTVLSGLTTASLNFLFDPITPGDFARTVTIATDNGENFVVTVTAHAIDPDPVFDLLIANNNCGGVPVGTSAACTGELTVTNRGLADLTFTPTLVPGSGDFSLGALNGVLQTLEFGQSLAIPVTFAPTRLGLLAGLIRFTTNDPDHATVNQGVVGSGIPAGGIGPDNFDWGNDFVAVKYGTIVQRVRSNAMGNFSLVTAQRVDAGVTIFDPASGYVAAGTIRTGAAFEFTDLTSSLAFEASTAPDSDFDGLPDDIEFALGTGLNKADTDGDGLSDFAEIQQGLDPFGGRAFPTGVIATVALDGSAQSLVVEGSRTVGQQSAYVATGSGGLAIVDVSKFDNPVVLGQLDLPQFTNDVDVDTSLGVAVLTTGGGIYLVDVSDPMEPILVDTIDRSSQRVEIADGFAYVSSGNQIALIDLLTHDVLDQHAYPGGQIDDMAVAGDFLYVVTTSGIDPHTILRIPLADFGELSDATAMLQISGHPHFGRYNIAAGGGLIYVASPDESFGVQVPGVEVIRDDGNSLVEIGPSRAITAFDIALNGSGLGVYTGANSSGPAGADIALLDLTDPTDTSRFVGSFPTPGGSVDVAIASGIAFAAAQSSGLHAINYLPFDAQGQAPTVTANVMAVDADSGTPGIQIREGSTLRVRPDVSDDVQVRNVELLVSGRVVANDVSFPFEFAVPAQRVAGGGPPRMTVQVRATDTGGNSALSALQTFDLVPDPGTALVTRIDPADGAVLAGSTRSVRIGFTESLDAATVTPANFHLLDAAGNAVPLRDVSLRGDDRVVQLTFAPLPDGEYRSVVHAAGVTDRTGTPLGMADIVNRFTTQATLQIDGTAADRDSNAPGLQVLEGSAVPVRANFFANGFRQGVELIIDIQVVRNDLTLPADFNFIAPLRTPTKNSVTVRLAGRDDQGRTIVSNSLTFELLDDTTAPAVTAFNPADGGNSRPDVRDADILFSEPIDAASLNAANFRLVNSQGMSVPLSSISFVGGSSDQRVRLSFGRLPQDDFRIVVRGPGVTDLAGNQLGTSDAVARFSTLLRIDAGAADMDLSAPGIQVFEATTIPIRADFASNPPLTNVELFVNRAVVRNDLMLPSNFTIDAPLLPPGPAMLEVRVAAIDNEGQMVGSNTLTFQVLNDTIPPQATVTPSDGTSVEPGLTAVDVGFSESISVASVSAANFRLEDSNGNPIVATSIGFVPGTFNRVVRIEVDPLPVGNYRIVLHSSAISDRAGNALGTSDLTSRFVVRETLRWVNPFSGGDWNNPINWDKQHVPGPLDNVIVQAFATDPVTITGGAVTVASLDIQAGTLDAGSMLTVNGDFHQAGFATLTGAADVVLNGTSELRGGEWAGTGRTHVNGTLVIGDTQATTRLAGRTLVNAGTVIWDRTPTGQFVLGFFCSDGAVWNNLAGSVFDIRVDGPFFGANAGEPPCVFNNAGTIRKSAGAGSNLFSLRPTNTGTVAVQTGTLILQTAVGDSSTSSGSYTVAAGTTLNLSGTQTLTAASSIIGDGTVFLEGDITVAGRYDVRGGTTIETQGLVQFTGTVVNLGAILDVFTGEARLPGPYTQSAGQTLDIHVGQSSGHNVSGSLTVPGRATLAGTLNVSLFPNYDPAIGDTFQIVRYTSRSGQFATVNGLSLGGGKALRLDYKSTFASVTVVAALTLDGAAKPHSANDAAVTRATIDEAMHAAIDWWLDAGMGASLVRPLRELPIHIVDLPGAYLGQASSDEIWIDKDAAGHGWYFDRAVEDDEFSRPKAELIADRIDLLTVLAHELGHILGLDDVDPLTHPGDVMAGTLAPIGRELGIPR